MQKQRYFLKLAYKGTPYAGWQRQPNALGIQEIVEEALSQLLKSPITIVSSSRTDAGVHALAQVVHFDAEEQTPSDLLHRLNSILPNEIAALDLIPKPPEAHARYDASMRRYIYKIHHRKQPLLEGLSYRCPHTLDLKAMNKAARICLSYRDFSSFARSRSNIPPNCRLYQAQWQYWGEELLFTVSGNRFLRGMVRTMVALFIEIGRGRLDFSDTHHILQAQDRSKVAGSAPPHGLYLVEVHYPKQ